MRQGRVKNKGENPREQRRTGKQATGAKVREKAAGDKTRRPGTKQREGTSKKGPVAA